MSKHTLLLLCCVTICSLKSVSAQKDIATIKLQKGIQTFIIHTVDIGNMNYDYINFKKKD